MLSVTSAPLRIGDRSTLQTVAHRAMRFDRLIVASSLASNFAIRDIRVNEISAFVFADEDHSVPAQLFTQDGATRLELDDVLPGATITIVVERVFAPSPSWLVLAVRRWLWLDNSLFGSKKKELAFSAALLGYAIE